MIVLYCLAHCVLACYQPEQELIMPSAAIFIVLSAQTQNNISGLSIQQLIALLGFTIFISFKVFSMFESLQKVALFAYIVCLIASSLSWFLFTPHELLKDLPPVICQYQWKYYTAPSKSGRRNWVGQLAFIRLSFPEYLQNSVLKNLST